jgi:diguanylate cyclase (GGDEF)-like protein
MVGRVLARTPFADAELHLAPSAAIARDTLAAEPVGLILLAIRPEDEAPLDLLWEVRSGPCAAPIILLVADERAPGVREGLELGAVDFLVRTELRPDVVGRAFRYALTLGRLEGRLKELTDRDPVTGLANRPRFRAEVERALDDSARSGLQAAVLLLDLDGFTTINDAHGQAVGDALLRAVSQRLRATARTTDTVARLGGDEFAILATNVHRSVDLNRLARRVIDVVRRPVEIEGVTLATDTAVGIAVHPTDARDADLLLENADLALYRAKSRGPGQYQYFDAHLEAEAIARRRIESELAVAVREDQLLLHYQPQVGLVTDEVVGAEALVRWNHPQRGVLPPDQFLARAEATGLSAQVTEWVLRHAAAAARRWVDRGWRDVPVWVNLAPSDIRRLGFFELVVRILEETRLSPRLLGLEMTESAASFELAAVRETLDDLRELGVGLAIDNFGKGRAALGYLRECPITRLKIDRGFVGNMLGDARDGSLVEAAIRLSRGLGVRSMAEGVERPEQLERLWELGCDEVQGFLIARPMAEADLDEWARSRMSGTAA